MDWLVGAEKLGRVDGRFPSLTPGLLIAPFELNQNRCLHIPQARRRVTNWPAYDAGLRQRGSLMLWFTDEAIENWQAQLRTTRGGHSQYSPLAILTALTQRDVFHLAYRQAEGLIGSIFGLLGLSLRVPDHTTLSRRAATLEVLRPGNAGAGAGGEPMHLLVDSTGLKLCDNGRWRLEKHGTASTPAWPNAILKRRSSPRRARTPCRATRPTPHPHSGTASSSTLPGTGACLGRQRLATTRAPEPKPP